MLVHILEKHYNRQDFPIILHYEISGVFELECDTIEKAVLNEPIRTYLVFVPEYLVRNNYKIHPSECKKTLNRERIINACDYNPGDIIPEDINYDAWIVGIVVSFSTEYTRY